MVPRGLPPPKTPPVVIVNSDDTMEDGATEGSPFEPGPLACVDIAKLYEQIKVRGPCETLARKGENELRAQTFRLVSPVADTLAPLAEDLPPIVPQGRPVRRARQPRGGRMMLLAGALAGLLLSFLVLPRLLPALRDPPPSPALAVVVRAAATPPAATTPVLPLRVRRRPK